MQKLLIIQLIILFVNSQYQGTYPYHDCDYQILNDGKQYFESIYQQIENAKYEVFIAGWKIIPEEIIYGRNTPTPVSLKECLLNAKNRGVKVYVLFWSSPILNFLGKDWLSMRTKEGFNALKSIGINVLIDQGRGFFPTLRWSQHQKFVVIDRQYGYAGGIDLSYGRFDTSQHQYMDPIRISNSDEPDSFDKKKQYYPWHDAAVKVNGQVVTEMGQSFIQVFTNQLQELYKIFKFLLISQKLLIIYYLFECIYV